MLSRRDFIKMSGPFTGSLLLSACRLNRFLSLTAFPSPTRASRLTPASTSSAPLPTSISQTSLIPAPAELADAILINGNFITMDAVDTIAQALAMRGARIWATGTNQAIRRLAGENTRTIDLHGQTVTPGLIDAHNHLQLWGTLLTLYLPLIPPAVTNLDQLLARLSEAVHQKAAGAWILGYFWNIDPLPSRQVLDPLSPDNPVWLMQQGGHFGCCNSLALKIAGITSKTSDPQGGVIQRDRRGEPTGVFYNHRAMDLVRRHAPRPTPESYQKSIQFGEQQMIAAGVTTFHDCNVRFEPLQAYLQAGQNHAMTLRAQVFYTLEWPADLERALHQIGYPPDEYIRFAGYKFLIDGQFPTWYTHQPHPGIRWNMPTWDPKQFKRAVRLLHDTGLQVAVHCCGDAAVDLVLDAYEEAMQANPRPDPRHRLEHAMLCSSEAVRRAADLGVVISCQPQFLHLFRDVIGKLGKERASRLVVTRDWLEAGVPLALGSDAPTVPWYTPQMTLFGAVVRKDASGSDLFPEQSLTIQEALRLHTMGSAYAAFEENLKGSLEPGKFADLAVWRDDPYSLSPRHLPEADIVMTIIGGKIVYQS